MLSVFLENGAVEVRDARRPRRSAGFALIKLLCGGICNTDLELQRGYYGFSGIPGHEFVGEVVEAESRELVGKRVVGEINLGCGTCGWCRKGLGRHCPKRTVLGIVRHPGAFREFLTLPERNLHIVPESVETEAAVFVEPLAAACEILDQVKFPKRTRIAVLGDGKLGLLVAQVLQSRGFQIHQYGRHEEKLRISARSGIDTTLLPKKIPIAEFECVVEATGTPDGLAQAVKMVRPRGTVVMKSTVHKQVRIDTAPVVVNEIILLGSRCGRFEPALSLLREKRVNVLDMISARFPLSEAPRAFKCAAKRGTIKVLLT